MDTGLYISIGALIIAFLGLVLNSRKETRTDAATTAQIQAKLDNLITGVNDIRVEVRSMREIITDHSERLAKLEMALQSTARRLDTIEANRK